MSTLTTPRTIIYPHTLEDELNNYELHSNPDVMMYIGSGAPLNKKQCRALLEKMIAHHEEHGFGMGAVYHLDTGDYMGRAGLIYTNFQPELEEIEVGYALLPQFWGQGYGTELTQSCLEYAFDELALDEVVAYAQPGNGASNHILEKVGMVRQLNKTYPGSTQIACFYSLGMG